MTNKLLLAFTKRTYENLGFWFMMADFVFIMVSVFGYHIKQYNDTQSIILLGLLFTGMFFLLFEHRHKILKKESWK